MTVDVRSRYYCTAAAAATAIQRYLIFVIKYCAYIELLYYYIRSTIMFTIAVYVATDVLIDMQCYYLHILAELYPVTRKSE